ncbi:MAG: DUF401 family protein [Sulfolobales archaeon]
MMIEPAYAFLASIVLTVILIIRRIDISIALGLGIILYSLLTIREIEDLKKVLGGLENAQALFILLSLIQAMFLADLYRESGVATKMIRGISCLGERLSGFITPAIIGLLPMPGGAYISAVLADPIYTRVGFKSEEKTYINYWFRHIWVPIWPLYQNILIASALLGVSVKEIFDINWRITLSSILSGTIISLYILRKGGNKLSRKEIDTRDLSEHSLEKRKRISGCDPRGLLHVWPFIIISLLALALNVILPLTLFITLILFILIYRPSTQTILRALRYSLNISIIALLIEIFIFSELIRVTDLATDISRITSGYLVLALLMVPMIIGFGTAAEFAYVALAFPPFLGVFETSKTYVEIAFLGGFTGVMLSPSHACLVLSARYYNCAITKPYRYIIPSALLTLIITLILTSISRGI